MLGVVACRVEAAVSVIVDPRQLPLVELLSIIRMESDGIVEKVEIIGDAFDTTFYKVMTPVGSTERVRAPVLVLRQKLAGFVPNFLYGLVLEERKRLESVRQVCVGEAGPLH